MGAGKGCDDQPYAIQEGDIGYGSTTRGVGKSSGLIGTASDGSADDSSSEGSLSLESSSQGSTRPLPLPQAASDITDQKANLQYEEDGEDEVDESIETIEGRTVPSNPPRGYVHDEDGFFMLPPEFVPCSCITHAPRDKASPVSSSDGDSALPHDLDEPLSACGDGPAFWNAPGTAKKKLSPWSGLKHMINSWLSTSG